MNREHELHLSEHQIFQSLEEGAGLSSELKEHLRQCSLCTAERANLIGQLTRLDEMARAYAPLPLRKIRLPSQHPGKSSRWRWQRFGSLTAAGMAFALIGFVSVSTFQHHKLARLNDETQRDQQLMIDISNYEKSDLPQPWLDILGDPDVGINEEMLETIAPSS